MRVIYDFGLGHSTIRQSSAAPGSGRETVLVIARRDGAESGGSAVPSPLSGGIAQGDSVRVSPEALARSREVEAHEKSHLALLGGVASSPIMYDTARGPNGEAIKVGGSVKVRITSYNVCYTKLLRAPAQLSASGKKRDS